MRFYILGFLTVLIWVLCFMQNGKALEYSRTVRENRTFEIDWNQNTFLKDGFPFRFIAGSMHYFRSTADSWQRKLRTLRASGLNAVTTYVEWSLHNPKDGVYVWDGLANLERFIKIAAEEDLLVILRPGPYICAERDLGGFPYWLLSKYPRIQLRTSDIKYLYEIRLWYAELFNRISPFLYGNGGPIIMVQVENEYGSYFACDLKYRTWLRDETLVHVGNKAVLFTNDGPNVLACGHIDGVLATMDFGAEKNLTSIWSRLRKIQPNGPLVNAEFYPGWLTHWGESMARVSTDLITNTFIEMLNGNASVNFYMFYGGTNFGFTAGANDGGPGHYQPDITSYDYDAPMDEAGDPTPKYFKLREIIRRYLPLPDIPVPEPLPKKHYGTIILEPCCSILSTSGRATLSKGTVQSVTPKTFEALRQYSGFLLYETIMPQFKRDPSVLCVNDLRDRAYVYVNGDFVGLLSRETPIYKLPISASAGNQLQILVENQGRINFGIANDSKGIIGDVLLDKNVLKNWNITKYPIESLAEVDALIEHTDDIAEFETPRDAKALLRTGPTIFYGVLLIEHSNDLCDTYLDTTGWGKGVVFVNNVNLGRYWPLVGPQITLYIPREVLKTGENSIRLMEYQVAAPELTITLTDKPNLDGFQKA